MASILLEHATVDFPVYNASSRSLKNRLLSVATGGTIGTRSNGVVVVRGLDGISLSLNDGERVGLIGHNGSGKTTLLRVLSGVFTPSGGKISVEGTCTSLINISLGIDPEASGRQNITIRGALLGLRKSELAERREDIERFTELGDFLDMPVRTYSTGMQLRLAFAISTVIQPEILVLDEWLATGDEGFKQKADQRMRELVDKTRILVVASHSRELLQKNCNRIIWLEQGRVKMDGDPTSILNNYFGH